MRFQNQMFHNSVGVVWKGEKLTFPHEPGSLLCICFFKQSETAWWGQHSVGKLLGWTQFVLCPMKNKISQTLPQSSVSSQVGAAPSLPSAACTEPLQALSRVFQPFINDAGARQDAAPSPKHGDEKKGRVPTKFSHSPFAEPLGFVLVSQIDGLCIEHN